MPSLAPLALHLRSQALAPELYVMQEEEPEAQESEQLKRQREWVTQVRAMHTRGLLPKGNGVDSVDIIREMREERDQQLWEAITRSR